MMEKSCYHKGRITLFYLLILLFIIILPGCTDNANTSSTRENSNVSELFPVTITDDLGRQVTLNAEPQRIVSLAPSNTEILFFLGLGERIVGVTTFCDYPEEAKLCSKVGGFSDPSLEKIVVLKPDLILATSMHEQLVRGLEDTGLNVLVFDPQKIDDIFNSVQLIGRAAGVEEHAVDLMKDLKDRVNVLSEKVSKIPENQRPTVYYEMWYEPLMTVGGGTLTGQAIELAGGRNISADSIEQYPQLSEEVIIKQDPQIMIHSYGHADENQAPTPGDIRNRNGWEEISFVKTNKIYEIDADLLTIPSPRLIEGMEKMAEYLYPELSNQV